MTREEAIKIIDCYDIGFYDLSGAKIPADKLADAFDMAIEALQQEPIIQCKDCKYWQDNNNGYPVADCRWGNDETPDADDYCSFAERRAEQ